MKIKITSILFFILFLRSLSWFAFAQTDNWEQCYIAEQNRFTEVLQNASDEELFMVLKFAIAQQFVPNDDIDPFHDVYVMTGVWQRSLMIYKKLQKRKDLLKQVYPDLDALDNYIKCSGRRCLPYSDTLVSKTIILNVNKDFKTIESEMGWYSDRESLYYKYFGTPLLKH